MIFEGQRHLRLAPWMSIFPGVALLVLVEGLVGRLLAGAAAKSDCDLHLALLTIWESGAAQYTGDYRHRYRRSWHAQPDEDERDDADRDSLRQVALVVNAVKGDLDEGEDSDLYEAMGYTRKSERASGLHHTKPGAAAAPGT